MENPSFVSFPIGKKLVAHMDILAGKLMEFQSRYGDGRWVPVCGLMTFNGLPDTCWRDGNYRAIKQTI